MALYKATFEDFNGADGFLGSRKGARVGHNTQVYRVDADTIAVRYHYTDIVTYRRDGSVVLDNGGWATNTTRERLRAFSPVGVYQAKGREFWTASRSSNPREFTGRLVLSPAVVRTIKAGASL